MTKTRASENKLGDKRRCSGAAGRLIHDGIHSFFLPHQMKMNMKPTA